MLPFCAQTEKFFPKIFGWFLYLAKFLVLPYMVKILLKIFLVKNFGKLFLENFWENSFVDFECGVMRQQDFPDFRCRTPRRHPKNRSQHTKQIFGVTLSW